MQVFQTLTFFNNQKSLSCAQFNSGMSALIVYRIELIVVGYWHIHNLKKKQNSAQYPWVIYVFTTYLCQLTLFSQKRKRRKIIKKRHNTSSSEGPCFFSQRFAGLIKATQEFFTLHCIHWQRYTVTYISLKICISMLICRDQICITSGEEN